MADKDSAAIHMFKRNHRLRIGRHPVLLAEEPNQMSNGLVYLFLEAKTELRGPEARLTIWSGQNLVSVSHFVAFVNSIMLLM